MAQHNARVAKGMGWLVSASLVSRSLGILSMLVLTRLLIPEDFGLVALATTLLQILSVVTEMQLTAALIQLPEVEDRHLHTSFTLAILRGILVAIAMVIGGFVLAQVYADQRLIALAAVLAIDPLANGLRSPRFSLFDKDLRFGFTATLEMAGKFATFAVTVVVALLTRSYWAIAIGQIAGALVITAFSHFTAPYRPAYSLAFWRRILSFSAWLNMMGIVSALSSRLDNFFVAGFLSKGVLGHYVVGNQIGTLVYEAVLSPLQRALFPGFAKVAGDREALKTMYDRAQGALICVGLPIGLVIAFTARPAVLLFVGPRWIESALVVEFIAPMLGVQMLFGPVGAVAMALGETRKLFLRSAWNLLFRLPAVVVGLWLYGIVGMLVARTIVGTVLLWVADATLISNILGVSLGAQIVAVRRTLLSGLVLGAVGVALRVAVPLPEGQAALFAYIAVLAAVLLATYVLTHALLWRLAGRPDGPEQQLVQVVTARFRRRAAEQV